MANPDHLFEEAGTYNVVLTVMDSMAVMDKDTLEKLIAEYDFEADRKFQEEHIKKLNELLNKDKQNEIWNRVRWNKYL